MAAMSLDANALRLCNCNKTIGLDPERLAAVLRLGGTVQAHTALCRQEIEGFRSALRAGDPVLVACTQEAALFREVAREAGFDGSLRFVNIREQAGWTAEPPQAVQAKIAALLAAADLPEPEPVAAVSYRSGGALLIVGPLESALDWAQQLAAQMDVSVLATATRSGALQEAREYPVWTGRNIRVSGFLGAFEVQWEQENPIDLDLCTRCGACLRACPEGAIGFDYQVDTDKCRAHRACVAACGAIGAVDFGRIERARSEAFDLVLDLCAEPLIRLPHPPQGYLAPGRDPLAQARAAHALSLLVGEFEKPKFFDYKASLCAHGRNRIEGCRVCIDVCSTGAIRSAGDRVEIEPHLCMGCGGCATVCPSGAMRYAYPRMPDLGLRLKTLLATYLDGGGRDACLLFHDERSAPVVQRIGQRAARGGRGLPARLIPFSVHRTSALGLDFLLAALAYGASQCVILSHPDEPSGYVEGTRAQIGYAESILHALGYPGTHIQVIESGDPAAVEDRLWGLMPAAAVHQRAGFNLQSEKRQTLELVFEHLLKQAPAPVAEIPLAPGAPWGAVNLDKGKCTLCMSCVGACPESALMDAPDFPRLRFVERNCVQCGLCVKTCPEDALALVPRLLFGEAARRERVLNEAEPFHCVNCGKPFSTRQMVDNMTGRLASHSMFQGGGALERLRMCADCRVVDMMGDKGEMTIFDVGSR
jgi:ferredoxin